MEILVQMTRGRACLGVNTNVLLCSQTVSPFCLLDEDAMFDMIL